MIESFINIDQMKKRPLLTFAWAFLLNSIAIIIASQIRSVSNSDFGFLAVLFTIIPSVYFIVLLIKKEEISEEAGIKKGKILFWKTHGKDIAILLLYFFGVTISFAVWSFVLPEDTFSAQTIKINEIRGTGAITQQGMFESIFTNNLQVMAVAFIFSIIFGAGAIFIIVWNASVLGVFIGQFSKSLWQIPLVSLGFLPHGIPEIGGYLSAALAGGILKYVLLDSAKLLLLGIALVALGAGIEAFL